MSRYHLSRDSRDTTARVRRTLGHDARRMNLENRIATTALGVGLPLLSFASLHLLHPAGQPENMTDTQITRWAESGAHQLWLGGSLGLLSVFLLLAWGVVVANRTEMWETPPGLARAAYHSVTVLAGLVAVASILQVTAAVIATPGERLASSTLLPVLILLAGNVNVASWFVLAPVGLAVATASGAPRWLRVTAGLLGAVLTACIALPFVSWVFAFVLVILVAVAGGHADAARLPQVNQPTQDGAIDPAARILQ